MKMTEREANGVETTVFTHLTNTKVLLEGFTRC